MFVRQIINIFQFLILILKTMVPTSLIVYCITQNLRHATSYFNCTAKQMFEIDV